MVIIMDFIKYPRTEHIPYSKEIDTSFRSLSHEVLLPVINGVNHDDEQLIIVEEKMDGIGLGLGFENGIPYVQQRGHVFLLEQLPHFLSDFKQWIMEREEYLYELIQENYVLFGEWLKHTHSIYYNQLPDYFLEYDIYSKQDNCFLSTASREILLSSSRDWLFSVKVLEQLNILTLNNLSSIFEAHPYSYFKNKDIFNIDLPKRVLHDMNYEGFYIKIENKNSVLSRHKWISCNFIQHLLNNEHWKECEQISNTLLSNSLPLYLKNI